MKELLLEMIEKVESELKFSVKNNEDLHKKRFLKDILFGLHELRRSIESLINKTI
ncbi:hypothetical protein [Aliarcobacter butzleri]|uniref:hypothetical protein n=1 Tax=Aliarcobacter butzleri TaxID=28197 RepID=UPI00215AB8FC|nr:hypothetical protein [Aliarcobacter butzleri]MCR8711023.1 hypothetical protein [Aliarcobacter butzleri]